MYYEHGTKIVIDEGGRQTEPTELAPQDLCSLAQSKLESIAKCAEEVAFELAGTVDRGTVAGLMLTAASLEKTSHRLPKLFAAREAGRG